MMPQVGRECGTKAKYHLDGCRCDPCTEAARVYGNHRARQIAYGRWEPYVDAEPARQHVLALRAAGLGPVTLARLSGVPHGALAKLVYGDRQRGQAPSKRIRHKTAERILAVQATIDTLADGAPVDSIGTQRRAQALCAIGYSLSDQARRLGYPVSAYHRSMLRAERVTAGRARAVRDLYDELAMTPGPSRRARLDAAKKGWPPPLAWDDIDDPDEIPCSPTEEAGRGYDQAVVERVLGGDWRMPSTDAERTEIARRWYANGRSLADLERLTGFKPDRYYRLRDQGDAA